MLKFYLLSTFYCAIPENFTAPEMENCKWSDWLNTDSPSKRDEFSTYEGNEFCS